MTILAVIFEVKPKSGAVDPYFQLAASLRPELERIDGWMANWRFASRRRQGHYLSLSFWRDEDAIARWRNFRPHHAAQSRGRAEIFEDYRIRVGDVVFDSEMNELPETRGGDVEAQPSRMLTISEMADDKAVRPHQGLLDCELFESLADPGHRLLLASWCDGNAAASWRPAHTRHRQVRVLRDYGMRDRFQAPQSFPVER